MRKIVRAFKKFIKIYRMLDDDFLREARYSLTGDRFHDLKRFILLTNQENFNRRSIKKRTDGPKQKAIIAPSPVSKTGIAEFTVRLLDANKDFLYFQTSTGAALDLLDDPSDERSILVNDLTNFAQYNLSEVIVMLGNSFDFSNYKSIIRRILIYTDCHVSFYVHDSILSNVKLDFSELKKLISGFENRYTFIFNSDAAKEQYLQGAEERCVTLFHPIFSFPKGKHSKLDKFNGVKLGVFGYPSGHKLTLETYYALVKSNLKCTLVFGGYDAERWLRSNNVISTDNLTVLSRSNCSTNELCQLMSSVDVAIQLRDGTTCESSGVIPQLISLNAKVIVSDVPQNAIYSDYCAILKNDDLDKEIKQKIETLLSATVDNSELVKDLSSESWWEKYFASVSRNILTSNTDDFEFH